MLCGVGCAGSGVAGACAVAEEGGEGVGCGAAGFVRDGGVGVAGETGGGVSEEVLDEFDAMPAVRAWVAVPWRRSCRRMGGSSCSRTSL